MTGNEVLKLDNMGQGINRYFTSHNIVILGRDEKTSDLNDISTWKGITVIDTWREGQIHQYTKEEQLKSL